jgi:glutathione S-transferase
MKLFYSPGACSHAPHILLREAGLDFTLEKVDLAEKKTETGADFKKISPHGYVPALQLNDGSVLTEGPAIDQYIADLVPAKKLAPGAGTPERYKLQSWLNFISTELHKQFSPLFNKAVPEEYKSMVKEKMFTRFDVINDHLSKNKFIMAKASARPTPISIPC